MKAKEYNRILVEYGERDKLMSLFNCTYPTVRKALSDTPITKLHLKIRMSAVERGGVEMKPAKKRED